MKCELCKNVGKKRIMKFNMPARKVDIEFYQCDVCFEKIRERIRG